MKNRYVISLMVCIGLLLCVHPVYAVGKAAAPASKVKAPQTQRPADPLRAIAELTAAGRKNEARQLAEDTIISHGSKDVKERATLQLYTQAQEEGTLQDTVERLQEKLDADPDNAMLRRAVAEGRARLHDWNEAAREYEKMVRDAPDDSGARTRMLETYMLAGQADKAVAELEPVVEANPGDVYNSDLLLNAYVKAGMKDKALTLYQSRLSADPGSAGLHARYAQALLDFGLLEESLKEWQTAARLYPSEPFFSRRAQEIAERLQSSAVSNAATQNTKKKKP